MCIISWVYIKRSLFKLCSSLLIPSNPIPLLFLHSGLLNKFWSRGPQRQPSEVRFSHPKSMGQTFWAKSSQKNYENYSTLKSPSDTKVCFLGGIRTIRTKPLLYANTSQLSNKNICLVSRIIPYESTDLKWSKCLVYEVLKTIFLNLTIQTTVKSYQPSPNSPNTSISTTIQHLWRFSSVDSSMAASSCLVTWNLKIIFPTSHF